MTEKIIRDTLLLLRKISFDRSLIQNVEEWSIISFLHYLHIVPSFRQSILINGNTSCIEDEGRLTITMTSLPAKMFFNRMQDGGRHRWGHTYEFDATTSF